MNKAIVLSFLFLLLAIPVSAEVPELEVSPGDVNWTGNDSIDANRDYDVEFDVTNLNESQEIYDVEFEDQDWITWNNSENGTLEFDLNENGSRDVSATINTREPGEINDSMEIPYRYNNSGDITSDSNYFPELEFLIESEWVETEVSTDIFEQNYELELGEERNSVFRVVNEGDEEAYRIEPSGEHLDFEPQEFNVSNERYVDFSMLIDRPDNSDEATNMTNQTYETEILVSGDNFEEKEVPINLTVPYKEYEEDIRESDGNLGELFEDFQDYCQEDPGRCNITETVYENRTEYVNQTPVYEANFTEEEKEALSNISEWELERNEDVRDQVNLNRELIRSMTEKFNSSLQDRTGSALNESETARLESEKTKEIVKQEIEEREQRRMEASKRGTIAVVIFLVLGGLSGLGYLVLKISRRSNDYRLIQ